MNRPCHLRNPVNHIVGHGTQVFGSALSSSRGGVGTAQRATRTWNGSDGSWWSDLDNRFQPGAPQTLAGLSRLRMPRWSMAVVTGILALGCLALRIAYATKPVRVVVHANHIEVTGPVVAFLVGILMDTLGIGTLEETGLQMT